MRRRRFLTLLAGAAALVPPPLRAQQAGRRVRIGVLNSGGDPGLPIYQAFREELRRLGYFEGQNALIEFRSAGGNNDRTQALANELAAMPVDIIVTEGTLASIAARRATSVIPIVIGVIGDPVGAGLVQSLARPGGNVTGFSILAPELSSKRVELLKEAVPGLERIGILWSPANPVNGKPQVESIERAASTLGIATAVEGADHRDAIAGSIETLTRRKISALITVADGVFFNEHKLIVGVATAHRLPAVYPDPPFVTAGGLMFYGPDVSDNFRRAARYVDRILKGANPSELPVEQPSKFDLIVNLKAAAAIGLSLPPGLLLRANHVIE